MTTVAALSANSAACRRQSHPVWLAAGHSHCNGREAEDVAARNPAAEYHSSLQFTTRATEGEAGSVDMCGGYQEQFVSGPSACNTLNGYHRIFPDL